MIQDSRFKDPRFESCHFKHTLLLRRGKGIIIIIIITATIKWAWGDVLVKALRN